jgi:hypothetical protein
VLNDEDFKIRHALEDWMRAISDHATTISQFSGGITTGAQGLTSYATDGEVIQYSRNDDGQGQRQAYKFIGMFPVNLGAIALDWETTDQIETFTCRFKYQWWEVSTPPSGLSD